MRLLPLCAAALLAGLSSPVTLVAADAAPAAATPAAASVPAVNAQLLDKALTATGTLLTSCQGKLELAKKSALLPFAGATVKAKVDEAQVDVDTAKSLHTDLTNLKAGKPVDPKGALTRIATTKAATAATPVLADRFKDIPGASKLTALLATPGLAQALISSLPVDKVPGFAAALAAFNGPAAAK